MAPAGAFDQPLRNPGDDLLGMRDYSARLADFLHTIEPPFTVGVYGEWGSGKSSFVLLLKHFLTPPPKEGRRPDVEFIEFSAWPYRTSDELWRALVLRIAERLCAAAEPPAVEPGPPAAAPAASVEAAAEPAPEVPAVAAQDPAPAPPMRREPKTFTAIRRVFSAAADWLDGDAFVLRDAPPVVTARSRYEALVAKLDETPYGTISKTPQAGVRIDSEGATLAMVKVALAALGSISPWLAGLRGLLGAGGELDVSKMVVKQNEALREKIQSVQQFRAIFTEVFEDFKAGEGGERRRVCVFVDDLDRCMPDVALDLLEAIKIFPEDVPCIFIVAADEVLIGQGLRMRFKGLLAEGDGDVPSLLARKGQEYFEKIIQFAIRVPYRTEDQTHRLISAHFPQWVAASDLIRVGVGDNPRRVKQYSHWLSYRQLVAEGQGEKPSEDASRRRSLLETLLTIRAWDPDALEALKKLALEPATYVDKLRSIEQLLAEKWDAEAIAKLPDPICQALCERVGRCPPLLGVWRRPSPLSTESPEEVAVLAGLTDVRPDSRTILHSSDGAFMRILERYNNTGVITTASLLQESLLRLMSLEDKFAEALPLLVELAQPGEWTKQMRELEAALDERSSPDECAAQPWRELFDAVWREDGKGVEEQRAGEHQTEEQRAGEHQTEEQRSEEQRAEARRAQERAEKRREALLDRPLLSTILPEVLLAYEKIPEKRRAQSGAPAAGGGAITEPRRSLANQISSELPHREAIDLALDVRLEAARYFRSQRAFAKVVALTYGWPDLAPLLRGDLSELIELEKELLRPPSPKTSTETPSRWERYRADVDLGKLIGLRPYFSEILPAEYRPILKVQKVAPATVPGAAAAADAVAAPSPPPSPAAAATTSAGGTPTPPAGVPGAPALVEVAPLVEVLWEDLQLHVTPASPGPGYKVTLQSPGSSARVEETVEPNADYLGELEKAFQRYPRLLEDALRTRDVVRTREAPSEPRLGAQLRGPGEAVYDAFFRGDVRDRFEEVLRDGGKHVRLLLQLDDPVLHRWPWECLYVPALQLSVGLNTRYSVVRTIPNPIKPRVTPVEPPLRVLAVVPQPTDLPKLRHDEELALLKSTLAERQQVTLEKLVGHHASHESLQRTLRRFKPHVFHFLGHGDFDAERHEGRLIFQSGDVSESMWAKDLVTLLSDRGVRVAVLNGCDTGTSSTYDALSGVAAAIVNAGVPAAIATMREVADDAALVFTREFYRALVDGYTLEASVVEARKALSLARWNWSIYALFSGKVDLGSLRLMGTPQRKVVSAAAGET